MIACHGQLMGVGLPASPLALPFGARRADGAVGGLWAVRPEGEVGTRDGAARTGEWGARSYGSERVSRVRGGGWGGKDKDRDSQPCRDRVAQMNVTE